MNEAELRQLVRQELIKGFNETTIQNKLFANRTLEQNIPTSYGYKSYKQLFNKETLSNDGFESFEKFLEAVHNPIGDTRLKALAEGESDSGGFLVPDEFKAQVLDIGLENEIVRPRAAIYPMTSNTMSIPGFLIGDHSSDGLYGGITEHWTQEAAQKSETDPKFTRMKLNAYKLVCYAKSSDELKTDSKIPFEILIAKAFGDALSFYMDYRFFQGTGAGQPLGVLNSGCLIETSKESNQAANTIIYENLTNMLSHLAPQCWNGAVWVAHISTLPQLLGLSIIVGTGGSHYPVLKENNGSFSMLAHPVIFTEKLNTLGDKGDLLLANFRHYAIGMKDTLKFESSIHENFRNDQTSWRSVVRVDGQPTWSQPLTLLDGSTEVSPFVTLEAR